MGTHVEWARGAAATGSWRSAEKWRKELTRELEAAKGERQSDPIACIRLGIEGEALLLLAATTPEVARQVVARRFAGRPTRAIVEERIRKLEGR
ncbi:MAG: hypothetical protein ACOZNI_19305 [Myxococcota bacterium]